MRGRPHRKSHFMAAGGAPLLEAAQYSQLPSHHHNGTSAFQLSQAPAGVRMQTLISASSAGQLQLHQLLQ
jgi:hypothetical protein